MRDASPRTNSLFLALAGCALVVPTAVLLVQHKSPQVPLSRQLAASAPELGPESLDKQTQRRTFDRPAAGSELLERMLAANALSAREAQAAREAFDGYAVQYRETLTPGLSEREQAIALHQFLHQRVLRGPYRADASDLAETLRGGAYNCLTASVVYLILAAEIGLPAAALAAPGHVWCRVDCGDDPLHIETTCANWFELLEREPTSMSPSAAKLLAEHQARVALGRTLDAAGLEAIGRYNRALAHLRAEHFAEALEANLAALELDPQCTEAYDNLLVTVNTWAVSLARQGRQAEAVQLLEEGLALVPEYEPFRTNAAIFREQMAASPAP